MNALILGVSLLITILYLILVIAHRQFTYWKNKNIPYVKPLPLFGNYAKYILLQEYIGHLVQKLCQKLPNAPYFGAFFGTEPVLVVQSPEILRHVFTKDFYYFHGREITNHANKEIVTQGLFFIGGNKWKTVRQNLSPLFSSAKMRKMFTLIENCSHVLEDTLNCETKTSNIIEARRLSARYTMDCFCSCVIGVQSDTLSKPVNNPFDLMGQEIFRSTNDRGLKIVLRAIWPLLFYSLGFKCFPDVIHTFFKQLLTEVFAARNYKPSDRNDFVDLLLDLKSEDFITSDSITNVKTGLNEKVYVKVDDELIVSQCVIFFSAGFETSSSVLSFTLYEFAKNQEVQKRAAEEVDEYLRRHGNKLNYECVQELPYVEACIYETMRKYPVIGNLTREVMDDYTLPDGLSLDKGVRVHIPVYHLHHNPDYFPEPEAYKPERFLRENKENLKPFTFFPFGEGPRLCIGKRFALMQVIAGLVSFLKRYRVELAENMPDTVRLETRSFLIQPREQGLMLKCFEREGWEQRKYVRN